MSLKLSSKLASKLSSNLTSIKGFKISSAAMLMAIATSLTACNITPASEIASSPATTTSATLSTNSKTEGQPLVVATNAVTCDLARQIAGDTIDLKCLIEPDADAHAYQPKPEDRKAIDSANLVLYGGYNLEPSLIKLIQASSNPAPKIAVGEVAVTSPLMSEAEKDADPHVWHNAQHGIKIAQVINKSLSTLRPDQAALYSKNTTQLVNKLEQIDTWIKAQIATIPASSRKLVTTHDALGYYAKAYDLPVEGALSGISTEEQPTPTRVKELVKMIKSNQVPTIFAEVSLNPKLITTVAKEANVKISERKIYTDGLGAKGSEAESYTGMLMANTRTIVEGLGGQYTPFQLRTP